MAFNLQEYILFRLEVQRELFNGEVDTNFKMVANPWVAYRVYEEGNIVYHPVEIEPEVSGSTGQPEQHLAWWRANKRTTLGVFLTSEWDLIGGIGAGDITVQGADSFGKFLINSTVPAVFNATSDVLIESQNPNDTLKLVAGPGISLLHDVATQSVRIDNLGATGEVNNGVNIGLGSPEDVYAGMIGTDLSFKGFTAANTGSNILSVSSTVNNNIEYQVDEGAIDLANLNAGSPTMDMLSDVSYSGLANGDLLQWVSGSGEWQPVPSSSIGSNLFDTNSGVGSTHRIGNPAAVGNYSTISGGQSNQTPGDGATVSGGSTNCASGTSSVVGGGKENCAIALASTVAGGCTNSNSGDYGSIGGGLSNTIPTSGDCATIGGGQLNCATSCNTTVSGGRDNRAGGGFATIGGGDGNCAPNSYTAIGGGFQNCAASAKATIGGGCRNSVTNISTTGTISGGYCNRLVSAVVSFIGGGARNFSCACGSVIGGGAYNHANGENSVIGGGTCNLTLGRCSGIISGCCNIVSGCHSIIAGGSCGCITEAGLDCSQHSTILGGCRNCIDDTCFATIGGGCSNTVEGTGWGTISGGRSNYTGGSYGVIAGGRSNCITLGNGELSFIGGGIENCINAGRGVIGGGVCNAIDGSAQCATIAGGMCNAIGGTSLYAAIGGGFRNDISVDGTLASISGGCLNTITDCYSSISGGQSNTISSKRSFIGSGQNNCITGEYSGITSGGNNCNEGCCSVISGGGNNHIGSTAVRGNIAGGYFNTLHATNSSILGGARNTINQISCWSTITGGRCNIANGVLNTISGCCNQIDAWRGVIAGGWCNYIQDYVQCVDGVYVLNEHSYTLGSVIGGGRGNCILFDDLPSGWVNPSGGPNGRGASTIAGGRSNITYSGYYGGQFIGGGDGNIACCDWTSITGGRNNLTDADYAMIGGGLGNRSCGEYGVVGGGCRNCNYDNNKSTITGGSLNEIYQQTNGTDPVYGSTISGGYRNKICSNTGSNGKGGPGGAHTISGGYGNVVCAAWGHNTIAGGYQNYSEGNFNSIAGGTNNQLLCSYGFAVGDSNTVDGTTAAAIGAGNTISTCGGFGFASGCGNTIQSFYSGALGRNNCVCHDFSFAIGCDITTRCQCTTHINCLNFSTIACYCGNADAVSNGLPVGQVYLSTECSPFPPFLTTVV